MFCTEKSEPATCDPKFEGEKPRFLKRKYLRNLATTHYTSPCFHKSHSKILQKEHVITRLACQISPPNKMKSVHDNPSPYVLGEHQPDVVVKFQAHLHKNVLIMKSIFTPITQK
jgi:hypothetical protein